MGNLVKVQSGPATVIVVDICFFAGINNESQNTNRYIQALIAAVDSMNMRIFLGISKTGALLID